MTTTNLQLRKTRIEDLDILFEYQLDEEANRLAAFTSENPADKDAYMAHWTKIVQSDEVNMQTILLDGVTTGSIALFEMFGEMNVSYWIGKQFWGQGIATRALAMFLESVGERPLIGRVAFDNYGSQKVLEKNGFLINRKETGFANARKSEIEEFVYQLK